MSRRDRYGEPASPESVPAATTVVHDPACRNGWLTGGDHPAPCPTCKPWLVACTTCGTSRTRCEFGRGQMAGRCCPQCPHIPPTRKRRRTPANDQEAPA